ncbi:MAG TPA: alpha/beta fold hydrolase [Chthoniobacteraceae bacterium]|nr:alpha/beta fold hydrolase [Chthoniobacteraceae bacterium]
MNLTAWIGAALSFFDGTARAPQHPVPDRNPVLLIHGIADDERSMGRMACFLRADGWEVHTLSLRPNWGQAGLEPLAGEVERYADREFRGRKFDLVGFSMGGLVSRYYMQRLGGTKRVEHFVTVSAPHHGTALASLAQFIPIRGCQEMRPGSPFLRDLDRDADCLRAAKFTSLYTPFDFVILPARSSAMPQARNISVPVALHPLMVLDRRCLRAVAAALRT